VLRPERFQEAGLFERLGDLPGVLGGVFQVEGDEGADEAQAAGL